MEDEFLLALLLEEDLKGAGHTVLGPYGDLARAAEALRGEVFDLALLDVNVNGQMVYHLADDLLERGLPFVLLSGYAATDLPERFRMVPWLAKPYDTAELIAIVESIA